MFARFRAFLAKGNINERRQLCQPDTYQPTNAGIVPQKRRLFLDHVTQQQSLPLLSPPPSHPQPHSLPRSYPRSHLYPPVLAPALRGNTTPAAKATAAQKKPPEQAQDQPLLQLNSAPVLSLQQIAIDHFNHDLRIEDASQLDRLVKAAVGFIEKQTVEHKVFDVWSSKSEIFDPTESNKLSRICRLFSGRQKLSQNRMLYDCADRLSLVFIHHEVSEKMRANDPVLPRYQKRITLACRDIAQELGITSASLKNHRDNGRCYLELFIQAGPGDLLALGPGQSTMYDPIWPLPLRMCLIDVAAGRGR